MTDEVVKMVPTKPEAEIAADLKARTGAALEPIAALMAEVARAGLLVQRDNISPDAFGRFHVNGLRVVKHYWEGKSMRDLSTYRAARRNAALRSGTPEVWCQPHHYHESFDPGAGSWHGRRRKAGRKIVKVAGKPASPVAKRVAVRKPTINKAAPRGT